MCTDLPALDEPRPRAVGGHLQLTSHPVLADLAQEHLERHLTCTQSGAFRLMTFDVAVPRGRGRAPPRLRASTKTTASRQYVHARPVPCAVTSTSWSAARCASRSASHRAPSVRSANDPTRTFRRFSTARQCRSCARGPPNHTQRLASDAAVCTPQEVMTRRGWLRVRHLECVGLELCDNGLRRLIRSHLATPHNMHAQSQQGVKGGRLLRKAGEP